MRLIGLAVGLALSSTLALAAEAQEAGQRIDWIIE